jgi:gamma-glutamylaminecyclotransferase
MDKQIKETPYVFVYGTLMKGFNNNILLRNSLMIDTATTEEKYTLVASGIPYLLDKSSDTYVSGEVYQVDENTLDSLDSLEGHPVWYNRRIINVISEKGDKIKAWTYFMGGNPGGTVIESGDYRDYSLPYINN